MQAKYSEILLNDHLVSIGLVILYWDHLLTLGDEIKYFWRSVKSRASLWFFLNRYLSALGNIPFWISNFHFLGSQICRAFGVYHQILLVVTQLLVGILLGLRLYALYLFSRRVGVYLVVLLISLLAVAVWGVITSEIEHDDMDCTFSIVPAQTFRAALPWECLFLWDLNLVCLILWKHYKHNRTTRSHDGSKVEVPLFRLIIRDGVTYFLMMLLANAANIIVFYAAPPRAKGGLSTFASAVSVSMMSRLMINLRKNASPLSGSTFPGRTLDILAFQTLPTSSRDPGQDA